MEDKSYVKISKQDYDIAESFFQNDKHLDEFISNVSRYYCGKKLTIKTKIVQRYFETYKKTMNFILNAREFGKTGGSQRSNNQSLTSETLEGYIEGVSKQPNNQIVNSKVISNNSEKINNNLEEISKEILPSDLENEKLRLEIERLNQALEEKNKKVSTKGGAAKAKKVSWLDLKEMELPEIYNEEEFRETWQSWCDFKHSRKESFTEKGIEIWFKKLETLSSRDLSISIQIVNESIANNWQGIFELKNQKSYAASKPNSQKSTTPYGAVGGVNSQGRGMFLIPLDDSTESSQGNDCIEVEGFYQGEL